MKTLLIDGQWCLKRNYFKNKSITNNDGYFCGGTIGFIINIQAAISKTLPDRVIVAWDGFHAGKLRYEIHKPYKAFKTKEWDKESEMIENEGNTSDSIEKDNFQLLSQKLELKIILDELFIRQIEVDYTEVNDLIAGYVLKNEKEDIIIFGSSKDFNQLISKNISIITPDTFELITLKNFKQKNGYVIDNELIFRCFEGNKSDCIDGVKGITKDTLMKFFPDIIDIKYTYQDLFNKSNYLINEEKKKQQVYKKIIESKNLLHRNAVLMNLKKPFLSCEAIEEIEDISDIQLNSNIEEVIRSLIEDGYVDILKNKNINTESFFSPFYMLMNKELTILRK